MSTADSSIRLTNVRRAATSRQIAKFCGSSSFLEGLGQDQERISPNPDTPILNLCNEYLGDLREFLMAKRMILMLAALLTLLGALGFVKYKQVETAVAAASSFQPPPEAVTSIVAKQDHWPATMTVIGTMEAVHGVTVSADLPG